MAKIKPGVVNLSYEERIWVQAKWNQIRKRQVLADKASGTWDRVNDEINSYLDSHGIVDVVQRDRIKGQSLELNGALAAHGWNAREAQRHIDDVMLFLKMKDLEVL